MLNNTHKHTIIMNKLKNKLYSILEYIHDSIKSMLKQTVLLLTQMIAITATFAAGLYLAGVRFEFDFSSLPALVGLGSSSLLWIVFLLLLNDRLNDE